jgi:hypothetical protein
LLTKSIVNILLIHCLSSFFTHWAFSSAVFDLRTFHAPSTVLEELVANAMTSSDQALHHLDMSIIEYGG